MTHQLDGEKLADLLAKVQAAKGADRLLDSEVHAACGMHINPNPSSYEFGRWPDETDIGSTFYRIAPVTTNTDDALALVDRAFGVDAPALCYSYDLGWHCYAHAEMAFTADLHLAVGDPAEMQTFHGQGASLPLAILSALLSSLKAST